LAAGNAGVGHPLTYAENQNEVDNTWPQDDQKHDGQQDKREGQLDIRNAHDDVVEPTSEVAADHTEQGAERAADHNSDEADGK